MGQIGVLFGFKIVSLLAAIAQTVGSVGPFPFEALAPCKWRLLIGGTVVIAISEGLSYLLAKRMSAVSGSRGEA